MLTPGLTFTEMIPTVLVAALLLILPGAVFLYLLSRRVFLSVAYGPAVSVTLVSVGGVLASLASVRWSLWTLTVLTILLWALGLGMRAATGRWGGPDRTAWGTPSRLVPALAGVTASFALTAWVFIRGTGAPGNFPQAPDMVFHLAVIRRFVETGDISSLTANVINDPDAPGFYPAAFHGLAATVSMVSRAPVPAAASALMLVVIGLVWPLGVVCFMRTTLRVNAWTAAVAVLLAGACLAFPIRPLVLGPVWPTVFGFALVLPALGLLALSVRSEAGRLRVHALPLIVFVIVLPGVFLAHSSALFGIALLGWCYLLSAMWASIPQGPWVRLRWVRLGWFLGLLAAGALAVVLAALIAPPGMRPLIGPLRAPLWVVRRALLGWPVESDQGIIVGWAFELLVLIGVVRAVRTWQHRWLAVGYLLVMAIEMMVETRTPRSIWVLAWPWYNLDFRLQAFAVVLAVPLAGLGLHELVLSKAWPRSSPVLLRKVVLTASAACLAVAVAPLSVDFLHWRYYPKDSSAWLTAKEAAALQKLSATLPDDAVVAANPWDGATYLSVIGPEHMAIPTEKARSADIALLSTSLDKLTQSPAVCAAVERHHVGYVITGGDAYSGHAQEAAGYPGIDGVAKDPDFRLVEQAGPYRLYKVPTCTP